MLSTEFFFSLLIDVQSFNLKDIKETRKDLKLIERQKIWVARTISTCLFSFFSPFLNHSFFLCLALRPSPFHYIF